MVLQILKCLFDFLFQRCLSELGEVDDRLFNSKCKWIMNYIKDCIPQVDFVSNKCKPNQSKCITLNSDGMKSLMLQLAEERATQLKETDMLTLKKLQ